MSSRIILILVSILLIAPVTLAESGEGLRKELETLLLDIQTLRKQLETDQSGYQKLQRTESKLSKKLKLLDQQIREQQNKLSELERVKTEKIALLAKVEKELSGRQRQIGEQLRVVYQMQGQNRLKLLLSANRPTEIMRDTVIYEYLHDHQLVAIEDSKVLLGEYQRTIEELKLQREKIHAARSELIKDRALKEAVVVEQRASLQKFKTSIQAQEQQITAKNKRVVELNEVLEGLSSSQSVSLDGLPKGVLEWPLQGVLLHKFGSAKNAEATSHWNGVAIGAPEGTVFTAIAAGQVVFSDWIRGLGIVAIVDHGQEYLSLYAHAQSVYFQAGDSVSEGQELGAVGDTGNVTETMLYFEVRKNGKPMNPAQWCVRPKLVDAGR